MALRVVVTGLGVVAPNGVGVSDFSHSIKSGISGIRHFPELVALGFRCHVGGRPNPSEGQLSKYLSALDLKLIQADGIRFGLLAGLEAWDDAGLKDDVYDIGSGCFMGAGLAGADIIREAVLLVDKAKVKKLGSTMIHQAMAGGVSAHLGGKLKLGNQVTTNASACSSGTEAIIMGFNRIQSGQANKMLCGACDSASKYVWAGFDAMKALTSKYNDHPQEASRPLSQLACGFVPGGGAGALVLESLESAQTRGANIYAEISAGAINSGGQQNGGSMTAPNQDAIIRCIRNCVDQGKGQDNITAISGHLTSTMADPIEIRAWQKALDIQPDAFPYIQSLKSMTGHCLSASGAIEAVACCLQINDGFLHPCLNVDPIHPDINSVIDLSKIPKTSKNLTIHSMLSANFGFGDVNSCILFKKFEDHN